MASKWENRIAKYKGLEGQIKKYGLKPMKAQVDLFLACFKAVEEAEAKVAPALVKARTKGVAGDTLADFRKDKDFNNAYKALNRAVDAMWKEQLKCRMMGNEASQIADDLKGLLQQIDGDLTRHQKELDDADADLKKDQAKAKAGTGTLSPSKLKEADTLTREFKKNSAELEAVKKEMAVDMKDLTEADKIYGREVDHKTDTYAAKFEKTVEKLLDLAPKTGSDQAGLPTALQERVLLVAAKKAVLSGKDVEKSCKYALEKAVQDKTLAAPDLKAARLGLDALKKILVTQSANRKKYATQIKAAKNRKDLYKQFKLVDDAFSSAEKTMVDTMKQIAGYK